jgi:hypothetical protein
MISGTMSGGGKSVCKGRMGSSVVSDVDTKDLANNETKMKKVNRLELIKDIIMLEKIWL